MHIRPAISVAILLLSASGARPDVTLPKIFADHMVLQRESPIHIWGEAAEGETITVEFHGEKAVVAASHLGTWSLYFAPMKAGGPYTLTVTGSSKIELHDIMLGDVWIASGQSNMEMPLKGWPPGGVIANSEKEISQANYPEIRQLHVQRDSSQFPVKDLRIATKWEICTPETAKDFSAVAYFFGRAIHQKEKVAVGLINSSWGGTPAEAWTSLEGLGADGSLMPVLAARAQDMAAVEYLNLKDEAEYRELLKTNPAAKREIDQTVESWSPAGLYNAMIAPLTQMPIRGVIWYQGESNSGEARAFLYGRLFSSLIQDWRRHWNSGNFPFLYVQLASFDAGPEEIWPLVREGQRQTLQLTNTGMAVAIDIGSEKNVHPPDKKTVGERLALWARSLAYGEKIESSGPLFRQAIPWDGGMQVWFDHADGLVAKNGTLPGFEVAGEDGKFVAAEAIIEGQTVLARNAAIPNPKYVRYGWTNFPVRVNLYNGADLPASPFTSLVYAPAQ